MSGRQKERLGVNASKIFVAVFFCTGLLANCARQSAPMGGPKDTLPPTVVSMRPDDKTINFIEKRIFIEFDEYVQLKDMQKEFFTSPGMSTKPTVRLRGRGIVINLPDSLRENTTYSLNFGSAIADNNEGNVLHNFRYVFSTGPVIDSMMMSGYTVNALKGDSVSKTFIWYYDAALDSVPGHDSTVFNNIPEAIARANGNGIFIARDLKKKDYRVYAVYDANNNQEYDAGTDMIGFLDSVYNPAYMPEFGIWYDTTRLYDVADPQLYFRMFTDATKRRQYLVSAERPAQHKAVLTFGAQYPRIDRITFSNIDTTGVLREYLKPTRDSIALWFDIPTEMLPDTIKGEITFMRHDSLYVLEPYTQELKLFWKKFESRQQQREREKLEKEIEAALEEGREPPKPENPFKFAFDVSNPVNPQKGINISFDYPLASVDSLSIALTQGEGEDSRTVPFSLRRDTMNLRKYSIRAEWNPGQVYMFTIPEGAIVDIAGQTNDTIIRKLEMMEPANFAVLNVEVTGKTPQSTYVLQLADESGKLLDEIRGAVTGQYVFSYVSPGKVKIMVIEDMNGNGVWDTGNMVERRHPERIETYMYAPGDPLIETKQDWAVDLIIDMNELFAPITMQRVIDQLRREEEVRLRKLIEEAARRREQQQNQQQRGGSATDALRGSGISIPGLR